jgi:hypothetical protein
LNEVLDARLELRNAWHDAKAYREALLPEWTIQSFRPTKTVARERCYKVFRPVEAL